MELDGTRMELSQSRTTTSASLCSTARSIASNDSRTGKFEENYTIDSWADRYVKRGGYFMKFYPPA